jgi:hypothetical protein
MSRNQQQHQTTEFSHGLDVGSLRKSNGHEWSVEVWHANVRFPTRQKPVDTRQAAF